MSAHLFSLVSLHDVLVARRVVALSVAAMGVFGFLLNSYFKSHAPSERRRFDKRPALEVLTERYVRGELSAADYETARRRLETQPET